MQFIRKHKILTAIVAVLLVLAATVVGGVHYFLSKITYSRGGVPIETAPTLSAPAPGVSDPESDDIGDISLDEKSAKALQNADDLIRRNLDDSKKWYSDQVLNVMLFGYDYGSKNYPYGRSDAMIVLSLNKAIHKVRIISLSRTAYAAIPGYPNTRLSHAHGYGGPALAMRAIELNYKFRIDNFISCSFDSFKQIIDAFGGVPITLTQKEAKVLRAHFGGFTVAGTYNLNGEQALLYARTRKIDTDRDRTGRQRKVIYSLAQKTKSLSVPDCIALLDKVLPLVQTDLTKNEIVYQLANALSYLNYDFEQQIIPAKPYPLVLRDDFEVILMNWPKEVQYLHDLMYEGVTPSYEG